jgi:hypothetical protein
MGSVAFIVYRPIVRPTIMIARASEGGLKPMAPLLSK